MQVHGYQSLQTDHFRVGQVVSIFTPDSTAWGSVVVGKVIAVTTVPRGGWRQRIAHITTEDGGSLQVDDSTLSTLSVSGTLPTGAYIVV